jgi:hypothetical protein
MMAVLRKLLKHPAAVHGFLRSVMQDVHLPEGQANLAIDRIAHGILRSRASALR